MTLPKDLLSKSTLPYFLDVDFEEFLDGIDYYREDEFHPLFGIPGNIGSQASDFTPGVNPSYLLVCTPISFSYMSIEYFKIEGRIWEHYYEDRHRGYLFQIIPYTEDISNVKFISY